MAETLTLTLLVDKASGRVVFAESDHRFVDALLSFLTLPLATLIRLLGDGSSALGSLAQLYKSVEDLDPSLFNSEACKKMLLRPRSAAGARCEGLAVNVDDSGHRVYYKCSKRSYCGVSAVCGVSCDCGGCCDVPILLSPSSSSGEEKGKGTGSDGVFVKGGRYMVSDDLVVRPVSMGESLELLSRLGIDDISFLHKKVVTVRKEEILSLLKRSMVSRMPLTDVFRKEPDTSTVVEKSMMTDITLSKTNQKNTAKRINVKLYLSAESNEVVYAEAGEDFVDLLLSFLTFPLGSVVRLLEKRSLLGCIDNLYNSAELLSSLGYMKSEECTNMLVSPMLPRHFGSHHQLLSVEEVPPQKIRTCPCSGSGSRCLHCRGYNEVNPKRENSSLGSGDGYTKGMVKFMVTDEMEVTAMSAISGFHIINKLMVPISSLEEAEASLGQAEALTLLKACLISQSVLSDVFSPYLMTLLEENWCGRLQRKCNGLQE